MSILLGDEIKQQKRKVYVSYGGGVNSTAMMIMLKKQGVEFEAVFVDHGGDYPETYEYVQLLQDKGYPITVIKAKIEGHDLYEYCWDKEVTPSRMLRWCTDKFKIRPLVKYCEKPCIQYLGIDAGEAHRAKPSQNSKIENMFPLVEEGIDRDGCKKIIEEAGLPLPRKSGCYFCPFQRLSDIRRLRDDEPDLWCKTLKLENKSNKARAERGKAPLYIKDAPLEKVVKEGQQDLFGWRKPCQCGL